MRHDQTSCSTKQYIIERNLPVDSDFRQSSHPLMIPLHCLWAKSNIRTHGQFECEDAWFCFCFDFVRSHARYRLERVVCLKLDIHGQGSMSKDKGGGIGGRCLENWTIFIDVMRLSSLGIVLTSILEN